MRFLKGIISKNKILKNFSVLIVSNAFSQILFMLSSIKIARSLTPVLFGAYNLLFVHVLIFGGLASLGLRNIIIRSVARDNGIVKRVFFISIILRAIGFLLSIILFCTYFILYPSYDDFLFILVILCILSNLLFDLSESVAFGLEKMEFSGVIILLNALFWFLTILLIPKSMFTLHLIFSLFVFFNSLKTIIYFFSIYKAGFIKGFILEHFEKRQIIEFSKLSFPYYYLALFTLISNQIPLLFLEYRSGVAQIGFFNIASKVLLPITLVLNTALAAIFPNISRLFITNYKLFIRTVKVIFILITLFGIVGAFWATLFRNEIINLLYGKKYISSSLVLGYQCWYVAIYSLVCLIGTILGAINKQKELSYLSIVCTIIQVPILWYGSKYGAQYLSAAFLAATIIIFIIHLFVINSYLKNELSYIFYFKITALFFIGYFVSLFTPVNLSFFYRIIFFVLIPILGGYFVFKKYKYFLKRILYVN